MHNGPASSFTSLLQRSEDEGVQTYIHSPPKILNAVFYLLKSGCPWRLLPSRLPAMEERLSLVQEVAHRRDLTGPDGT
jgi:hypothetical protein